MTRWLVRFGYDGVGFAGWADQPGRRTVEGEIRRRIHRWGWDGGDRRFPLEVASRTDRGVSARGNALCLPSGLSAGALLRALNGISPAIFFTAASQIPEEFRVRAASRRTYRYFESGAGIDVAQRSRAAALFTGRIDVRSFGRQIPSALPAFREVESVTVTETRTGAVTEVRAPAFVWGMVRKIVAALREHDADRISRERLAAAIQGRARLALPLAEPEPLVLWDVEYPLRWEYRWAGPNRAQAQWFSSARASATSRTRVLEALSPERSE